MIYGPAWCYFRVVYTFSYYFINDKSSTVTGSFILACFAYSFFDKHSKAPFRRCTFHEPEPNSN